MQPQQRSQRSRSQRSSNKQPPPPTVVFRFQNDDIIVRKILTDSTTIAVIGASEKPHRDSYHIMGCIY